MERIEKSIQVEVPVSTAYNQWTQFESFPQFMKNIEQVEHVNDKRLHWVASIAGKRKEWDAEIVDQVPDQVIAWRSLGPTINHGSVTFHPMGAEACRIDLVLTYKPDDFVEAVGDALGVLQAQVDADLHRFKRFIEDRATETGAWRGQIQKGAVQEPGAARSARRGTARTPETHGRKGL